MSENFKLPEPKLPKLEMPEAPKICEQAGGTLMEHPSCDGEDSDLKAYEKDSPIMPPVDGRPRIMIGVPILSYSHDFVESFLKFWTSLCLMENKEFQIGYHFMYRKPVHMAEIELIRLAQFNKCTHILLMDDDIYDVTLADLQKLIKADKDVISGVMYASKFPYAMCVFRRFDVTKKVIDMPADNTMFRLYEIPCMCVKCGFGMSHWDAKFCPVCGTENNNMIQKADLVPFPFTLIKLSIFDKLKEPWFHCTPGYPSDSWFCDRCHEAGVEIYAHMGVRLNHNGVTDLTRPYLMNMETEKRRAQNHKGIVPISAEDMEKHQYMLYNKMKEAEEKCKTRISFIDKQKEASNDGQDKGIGSDVQEEKGVEVPS